MRRILSFRKDHSTQTIIFTLLLLLIMGSLLYLRYASTDAVRLSLAANVATDAFFSMFTIFAIGGLESLRRKNENKFANELIYRDLRLLLGKTMLKLLIELGYADKSMAVRINALYQHDPIVLEIFKNLSKEKSKLLDFCHGLTQTPNDIKKMVAVIKIIRDGLNQAKRIAAQFKLGPTNVNLTNATLYKNIRIENMQDYESYLTNGKRYGLHNIVENGLIVNIRTEPFTDDWEHIQDEFHGELRLGLKYLLDIYELCEADGL